jgi:hypothetical protein
MVIRAVARRAVARRAPDRAATCGTRDGEPRPDDYGIIPVPSRTLVNRRMVLNRTANDSIRASLAGRPFTLSNAVPMNDSSDSYDPGKAPAATFPTAIFTRRLSISTSLFSLSRDLARHSGDRWNRFQ